MVRRASAVRVRLEGVPIPGKFHPLVARALIERYTESGDCVLDCFCASGTLL
jgi:hypothetical protein